MSPGLGTHRAACWVALVTPAPGQACGPRFPQTGCPHPHGRLGEASPCPCGTCHPAWGGSREPPKPQHHGPLGATLVPLTTGDTQHGGGTSPVTLGDRAWCVCVYVWGHCWGHSAWGQWGMTPTVHGSVGVSPLCPLHVPSLPSVPAHPLPWRQRVTKGVSKPSRGQSVWWHPAWCGSPTGHPRVPWLWWHPRVQGGR